jgi:two-component system alkaline phosphatase synthesis response regulator PhoP
MTKVLIADDDSTFRNLVKEILSQNGFEVFCFEDGLNAWDFLQKEKADIAILDINMPGINGIELLIKIRENENLSLMPVMMLTVRSMVEDQISGYKYGADDYLPKPFDNDIFLAKVKVLERGIIQK